MTSLNTIKNINKILINIKSNSILNVTYIGKAIPDNVFHGIICSKNVGKSGLLANL